MTTLVIFPGQGSQYRGMGHDLYQCHRVVRETYEEADDILDFKISDLSFCDPNEELMLTRYTQPAVLTHSIACFRLFSEKIGKNFLPIAAAGHSLGEYSALVVAGSLDFSSALKLVQQRGRLMGDFGSGEMEALPVARDIAQEIASQYYCAVAACNLPEQTVVAGASNDLDQIVMDLKSINAKVNTTRLKTEGAFHTYLMIEAAKNFRPFLDSIKIGPPTIPTLSNYSGTFHDNDPRSIRAKLFLQLFNPVLWYQNLEQAANLELQNIIEFGGGIGNGALPHEKKPNLAGIVKRMISKTKPRPAYYSVINEGTLNVAVEAINARLLEV